MIKPDNPHKGTYNEINCRNKKINKEEQRISSNNCSDSENTVGIRIVKSIRADENEEKGTERQKEMGKDELKKTRKLTVLLYCVHSHLQ